MADDAELQNRIEDLRVSIETLDTSIGSLQTVIEYMSSRFVTLDRSALSVMGRSDNVTLEVVKDFSLDHFGVDEEGYDRIVYEWLAYDGTYFYSASDTALLRWTIGSTVVTEMFTVAAGYYSTVKSAAYNPDDGHIYFLKTGDMKLYYIDLTDGAIHAGPTVSLTPDQALVWSFLDKLNSIFYDRETLELKLIASDSISPICVAGTVNATTGVMVAEQWLDLVYVDTAAVFWSAYHRGIIWYTKGEVAGQTIYGIIKFKNNSPVFSATPSDDVAGVNDWLIGMDSLGDDNIGVYVLTHYGRFIHLAPTASIPISDGGNVLSVDDAGGSLTVDATSLPLPTGAATSALQTTMVTALEKIDDLQNALAAIATDQLRVDIISDTAGLATTTNQATMITSLQLIDDLRNALAAVATDQLRADVISSALPTGAATSAKQDTMITALQLIDDLRAALATVATDQLRADIISSALPTGAATSANQATMITALQLIDNLQNALRSVSTDVLITQIEEAGSIDSDNVAMSDVQAEIVAARADRKGLLIQNVDTADTVWIGPTGVVVGTGIEMLPKQSTVLNHYTGSTASIFGICDAGKTANIRYLEAF